MTRKDFWRLKLARAIAPLDHIIIPKEPTKAMLKAACAAMSPKGRPTPDWVSSKEKHKIRYYAMIRASYQVTDGGRQCP
jgi:hypothetical protein